MVEDGAQNWPYGKRLKFQVILHLLLKFVIENKRKCVTPRYKKNVLEELWSRHVISIQTGGESNFENYFLLRIFIQVVRAIENRAIRQNIYLPVLFYIQLLFLDCPLQCSSDPKGILLLLS